ncbi:hypothetical protein FOZG_03875 [Fusarium oxysporum Fo47]|uniref:Uncharacterized protein n=1 Tax=Fusarium oxysporum Fo47 TaxID=660027 RepID=W9L4P6_FUSOX|nr:hypothetical protein FOZG_03875 [Fusarium oxysporum Fo47]
MDLAEQDQEVQQGLGVPYQVEDLRRFWRELSRDWNAFTSNEDNRHMPAITLTDARVQVGYLKYDHPQSLHYPDAPGAARKHLASVYMSISTATRDQMFTTIWKGGDRKFISPSHAELNGGTIASLQHQTHHQHRSSWSDVFRSDRYGPRGIPPSGYRTTSPPRNCIC